MTSPGSPPDYSCGQGFARAATLSVSCPLCGSGVSGPGRPHLDFSGTQIFKCEACEFWFGFPAPSDQALAHYYETAFGARRHWSKDPAFIAIMERRAAAQIDFMGNHLAPVRSALDVGCGIGALVVALSRAGIPSIGYDSDEAVVKIGHDRWGANIRRGHVDTSTPGERVDLLCLSHVVEHFADPVADLRRLATRVRPGGLLFVEVPRCAPSMFARQVDTESHLGFFSLRAFRVLAEHAGLQVERLASCGPSLEAYYDQRERCSAAANTGGGLAERVRSRCGRFLSRMNPLRWPITTEFDGDYDRYDAAGQERGIWLRALLRRPLTEA